jgi:AraC-like DNA-binding protein/mannose-6-phosphate isomerase-like protein (cupin superfamily)
MQSAVAAGALGTGEPAAWRQKADSLPPVPDALYQPFPIPTAARAHIWRYAPRNRRPRHFHSEPELNLVAAGEGSFGMGDTILPVTAGDLLWWPPGQDHELLSASPDFDLFVIGVTPALSERVLAEGAVSIHCGPVRLRLPAASLVAFSALCLTPLERQEPAVIDRHVGDLWRQAHALRARAPDMHTLTRRTLASLIEQPNLRRADVATLIRAYPSEVSRHFHKDMGVTLTSYRTRLRLLRFVEMVDGGSDNLLSAALEAGFGSYSQCHRVFQRTLGCAPRDFFCTNLRRQMGDAFSPWMAPAPPAAPTSSTPDRRR